MSEWTAASLFAGRGPGGKTAPAIADLLEVGDCWTWTGRVEDNGYVRLFFGGERWLLHRLVWSILVGPIPEGLVLDHQCKVRSCCNPDHLRVVTQEENNDTSGSLTARNKRKTHCPADHPYDQTNGGHWVSRDGRRRGRYCRACHRDRARAAYARKVVAA